MTIYTAGPMSGYPDFNYPAFRAAEQQLRVAGYAVLCPVDSEEHNDTGQPQTWGWYMRHLLRIILDAGGIAVPPGWESSREAQLEMRVATPLGLPVHPLEECTALAAAVSHGTV